MIIRAQLLQLRVFWRCNESYKRRMLMFSCVQNISSGSATVDTTVQTKPSAVPLLAALTLST